jgi:1,3-beta-glucanosyltransferase GAS1
VYDPTVSSFAQYINCDGPRKSGDFLIWGIDLDTTSFCVTETSLFQKNIVAQYSNYSIPAVWVYGCERGRQHNYSEVQAIYGDETTKVFSGGVVREWFEDSGTGADLGKKHNHLDQYHSAI